MKTTFIYALNDPRTGKCRYIGKANEPVERFKRHLSDKRNPGRYKAHWIADLDKLGLQPVLEVLDEVPGVQWKFWEMEYIRVFRAIGFNLTNSTEGGDGHSGFAHSEEAKRKISEASRRQMCSQEARERIRAAHLGRKISEETRQRMRDAQRGHGCSEEARKNLSAARHGMKLSQEHKANIGAAGRGRIVSPETREKLRQSHLSFWKKKRGEE